MIDDIVCNRLLENEDLVAVVGDRIEPVLPTDDSPLPYLYYWRLETIENMTLSGPTTPKAYIFAFDYWALTQSQIAAIRDALYDDFSTWHDADVRGAFRQTSGSEETIEGFHGQSTYQIFY